MVKEVKGDIFEYMKEGYIPVHCISLDCKMGAGLAYSFTELFPEMRNDLLKIIEFNNLTVESVILYSGNIFNLITKVNYFDKPHYMAINNCLTSVKNICIKNKIKKIVLPKIGCGLDGLNFTLVKKIIKEVFKYSKIEVLLVTERGE